MKTTKLFLMGLIAFGLGFTACNTNDDDNLDIKNPYTADIPIADIAKNPNLYRSTEYRFELVIVKDLPSGTRSSNGSDWGFSLRKGE